MSERIPIDPSHPANASALQFYRSHAVLDPKKRSPWDIDEYELHTHPDIIYEFYLLGKKLPPACQGAAFGYAILVNPNNGVLFATAVGMGPILIRLPESTFEQILALYPNKIWPVEAKPFVEIFGKPWVFTSPFQGTDAFIEEWLQLAYAATEEM